MVDFQKMRDDWYAGLSDEEKARVDAAQAKEEALKATEVEIKATFEELAWTHPLVNGRRETYDIYVSRSWEKMIKMRIETRERGDGEHYEVLNFLGGSTGYECFRLDEDFCALLTDPEELENQSNWYICAGTPGSWYVCKVAPKDVEDYLRAQRPQLFKEHAMKPTI